MNKVSQFSTAFLFLFLFVATSAFAIPDPSNDVYRTLEGDEDAIVMSADDWKQYSAILVDGIRSENQGIRESALRLSIQYADKVDVSSAALDLMHIYREAEYDGARHLAAVALASIDSRNTRDYLRLNAQFERNDTIRTSLFALTN